MKRLVALVLVLLLSINSFAAVVSDNDGSAFITKAEFDSLKNNFQSQIDQYNTSIDSKIDGAIAGYLAGIRLQKKSEMLLPYNNNNFWIYRDNGIAMPEINSRFLLHNFNQGDTTQRFKLWLQADERFKTDSVGAPPLWIKDLSDGTVDLYEDGSLYDKVDISITETYEANNYWGVWRVPDNCGVYFKNSNSVAMNLQSYNYEISPSDYGTLNFYLGLWKDSGVASDSGGVIKATSKVDGTTESIDWGNDLRMRKDSIRSYIANVVLSDGTKFVPLTRRSDDKLWCIQYNSNYPTLYSWTKSGIWATCLKDITTSGSHTCYVSYGNTDAVGGRTVGQVTLVSGNKWFYGRNNMYTTAQKRATSTSAYETWFTPSTNQIVIAPHSGLIQSSNIYQRIKDINGNKIKPYHGILVAASAEGEKIEFDLNLQAKTINSTGLVNTTQSYQIAASPKPFGNALSNTDYYTINEQPSSIFDLPSNGTYKITIEDIEMKKPVYFKIIQSDDVDVQVEISNCYVYRE